MNLLPVNVANNKAPVESTPGKTLNSNSETQQGNEFNSIFSESLVQQGIMAEDASVESAVTGQQAQAALLPAGGQHLPPAGQNLPLGTATTPIAEMDSDTDTSNLMPQLLVPAQVQEEAQTNIAIGLATAATDALKSDLPVDTATALAVPTSGPLSANIMNSVDSARNGLLTGISVMNTVALAETEVALQTNVSANQKPPQSTLQGLPVTQILQEKPLATAASTAGNAFSGDTDKQQLSSLPQMPIGTLDEKQDFSRIIEKGLAQLGKEMPVVNTALASEPGTRIMTESLKIPMGTLQLQQHIDKPAWSHEFGNKLVWMSKEGLQSAQIRLTPAHLGTIDVKIAIQHDQANISFMSQHGAVRDIIESSMPRLREMLNEAGIKLEQFNVSTNPNAQQQKQHAEHMPERQQHSSQTFSGDEEELLSSEVIISDQGVMLSAVDYYA